MALFLFLAENIFLSTGWNILTFCKKLGVFSISNSGKGGKKLSNKIANSRNIKVFSTSGLIFTRLHKNEIITALCNNSAQIKVLVAKPSSQFISDVEQVESELRSGQIDEEIIQVETLLIEYLTDANKNSKGKTVLGRIFLGYFTTQLRENLIACDDKWGWLTLILPPKRSAETASFELISKDDGLLNDSIIYFDTCWEIAEKKGYIKELQPR